MAAFWSSWFPLIAFFVSYKIHGLYLASAVILVFTLGMLLFNMLGRKPLAAWQLVNGALIIIMASATLLLHEEWFIKFKPTLFFGLMAVYLGAGYYLKFDTPLDVLLLPNIKPRAKPAARALMHGCWVVGLLALSALNVLVAYLASTNTWVNFKLFGTSSALLVMNAGLVYVLYRKHYLAISAIDTRRK